MRFAVDAVGEGLLTREEAIATIDPSTLDALLHPTFDPTAQFDGARAGRQRVAGRGQGRDRVHRRRCGRRGAGGPRRDPRAPVHRRRGRRRVPRRQRDPHQRGRQGLARGAGRARDGPPGGRRRAGARDRPRAARTVTANGTVPARGRPDRDRRHAPGSVTADDVPLVQPAVNEDFETGARAGPTRSASSASAPTPTRPRTRGGA